MPTQKTTKFLRVNFSAEENVRISHELAEANTSKSRKEEQKKSVMSQFKAEIDKIDADIKLLASKLIKGGEDRAVVCDVFFNTPIKGQKTVIRQDTREVVEIGNMSDDDKQTEMEFAEKDGAKTPLQEPSKCALTCDEFGGDPDAFLNALIDELPTLKQFEREAEPKVKTKIKAICLILEAAKKSDDDPQEAIDKIILCIEAITQSGFKWEDFFPNEKIARQFNQLLAKREAEDTFEVADESEAFADDDELESEESNEESNEE